MAIIGGGERDLTIKLFANVDDFKRNLKGAQKDTEDFGGKVFDSLGKVGLAVASAGAAVAGFAVKLGVDSVKAAIEANKQQERLAALLENTGGATQKQIQLLNAQAEELGKVGVATKENVTITQSQLATFDLMGGTIAKLTPAIIDYVIAEKGATASTDDFKSMTNGLAQALNGNFASLTATGFVLDDTTKELIKTGTETERAAALVDVLESTYRGFNETAGQTAEGQLIMLQNAFNDSTAAIGEALLPTLLLLVEAFKDNVLPRIIDFVDFIVEVAIPAIGDFLKNAIDRVTDSFGGLRDALQETNEKIPATGTGLGLIGEIAKEIALSIPKGIVWALELLGKALEGLVRLMAFTVLFVRGDFRDAYDILTNKTKEATAATADMYREFEKLNTQAKNASSGLADAYRELSKYNGITPTASTNTRDLKDLIEEFKNIQYDNTLATDKAAESTKRFSQAQKQASESTKELTALLRIQKELQADPTGANAVAAARGLRAGRAIAGLGAGVNVISLDNALTGSVLDKFKEMAKRNFEETGRELALENAALLNVRFADLIEAGLGGETFDAVGRAISQLTVEGALTGGLSSRPTGSQSLGELIGGRVNQVNININGTVINPEGAARAVQDLLQQSGNRAGELSLQPTGLGIE